MHGAGGVRVRPGGVRLPRHGPGDDRGRLVRPGHRQRAVGVRAVDDRDASRASRRSSSSDFGFDVRLRARQGPARGERRRRQHVQGDGQAGADRHGGRRRDDDDLLDHRGADRRADAERREAVDSAPAVPARPDHRRRGDLLVHRRVDAGGDHRRVPRGRVHQGEHQARRRRRRRRSRTARRSSRSARSTRRRACSTSS